MELSVHQQIFETLGKAKKVLIVLPEILTADSTASALAMLMFLKKLEKDAEVVSSGKVPDSLKFLPQVSAVKTDVLTGNSLVVVVNTSQKKLDEISYQTTEDKVQIFLKAKEGQLIPSDVSFSQEKFPVDVIVVLEAKSLDSLGKLFENHADLFFETTKVNIDNHAGNEYFGAINLVDVNASSVAEILSSLFEKYEKQLIDEDIATCLLTGIITKTNSFQHVRTTPQAFLKASELVSLGGRQQEVVKHIYKTKPLSLLRLWGRALARLKMPDSLPAIYSLLNTNDFVKAESSSKDLPAVLKELVNNVSGYKVMAVISEQAEQEIRVLVAAHMQIDYQQLLNRIGGNGRVIDNGLPLPFKVLDIIFTGIPLAEAENRFVDAVKSAQNLNLEVQ